jgi:hypothetical protein
MNDTVESLMKRSISAARKYQSLDRQLTQLIDQQMRAGLNSPLRNEIEFKKAAIAAEMIELSGDLESSG